MNPVKNSLSYFRKRATKKKKLFARLQAKNPTRSEEALWRELKDSKLGVRFRRQIVIEGWIVDFYCPSKRLVVELDGKFHRRIGQKGIDDHRDKVMSNLELAILRIDSERVFTDLVTVLAEIETAIGGFIYKV